jgi:hypothetical protein
MWDLRRHPLDRTDRSIRTEVDRSTLPATADATRGSGNLATIPRAGNISSDTRAGSPG